MGWRNALTDPPPTNVTQLVKVGGSLYFAAPSAYEKGKWYDVGGKCWMQHAPTHWLDTAEEATTNEADTRKYHARQLFLAFE